MVCIQGESLTHHMNQMKLFSAIAAFATASMVLITAGKAQTSIEPTTFIKKSECLMVAPDFNGRCNYVMITSSSKTTNIHFTRDMTGSQSMSFVIANKSLVPKQERIETVGLFIRNPGPTQITKSGTCMIIGSIVRCVTSDGQYSASAAN